MLKLTLLLAAAVTLFTSAQVVAGNKKTDQRRDQTITPAYELPHKLRGEVRTEQEVIEKYLRLTGFREANANSALQQLYAYGAVYREIYEQPGLNDAQRRVRVREARGALEKSLRETMKPNDVRKWLHFSLPRLPHAPLTNDFIF